MHEGSFHAFFASFLAPLQGLRLVLLELHYIMIEEEEVGVAFSGVLHVRIEGVFI